MPNPSSTIKAQSVAWADTYDNTAGGPVRVRWRHGARQVKDRTGADTYSKQLFLTEPECEVRVALRHMTTLRALGTKSNMTVTYKTKDGTRTRVFAGMVLVGIEASQDRDNLGEEELVFVDESTDGATEPVT